MDIVIVDDEPKIRNGIEKLLNGREGWRVTGSYPDGAEALKGLALRCPDVIITDIRMPEINGLDMIGRMREMNESAVIIILSGYSDFGFAKRAIELGVYRYLTKPTRTGELIGALKEIEEKLIGKEPESDREITNLMVRKAMDYISLNYQQKLGLSCIAGELHLSPNYLSELFKRHTGRTISEYITGYRLHKAKRYLGQPELKITRIAELVGFGDARYFSSMFKKQYGMTPLEYRNRNVK